MTKPQAAAGVVTAVAVTHTHSTHTLHHNTRGVNFNLNAALKRRHLEREGLLRKLEEWVWSWGDKRFEAVKTRPVSFISAL